VSKIGNQALIFLESVGIKVYKSNKDKAQSVIELFNKGKLEEMNFPNDLKRG
jgi:predicted Fe-Mo cluster-binding NifX family protein